MSFNAWLRRLVYGPDGSGRVNSPLRGLPAGFTGTTWRGTGFDEPPPEVVKLDEAALPWELRDGDVQGSDWAEDASLTAAQRRARFEALGLDAAIVGPGDADGYDWVDDGTLSAEETMARFRALNPKPTRGPDEDGLDR